MFNFSTDELLSQQNDIIRAFIYTPVAISKYTHYRGDIPIEFRYKNIKSPIIPLIPYNDPKICCILSKIQDSEIITPCGLISVTPLGTPGKIGVPYIIHDGTNELVVKMSKVNDLYSTYHSKPPTSIKEIDQLDAHYCLSNVNLKNIRYIASDEFTNETLIAYVLNYLVTQKPLPSLFVQHYQGAICSNDTGTYGLNIMENCDLGSLDRVITNPKFSKYLTNYEIDDLGYKTKKKLIDTKIVTSILTQITCGLDMLQSYIGFVSGDLKAGNVFLKSEPINSEYKGIKLKADFTCKIADYGKSSCMLMSTNETAIRFYNDSKLSNIYLTIHPFDPNIKHINDEYYYEIGNLYNNQIYTRTRHAGVPYFRSFDYYTMIVSTLTIPEFYYSFFATESLRKVFWDPIWIDLETNKEVINRIKQYVLLGIGRSFNDSLNILKGIRLRCGAVSAVIDRIQHP